MTRDLEAEVMRTIENEVMKLDAATAAIRAFTMKIDVANKVMASLTIAMVWVAAATYVSKQCLLAGEYDVMLTVCGFAIAFALVCITIGWINGMTIRRRAPMARRTVPE